MIEWLRIHYVEIFAIVGFLYSAARIIVVLTPTPKDNVALEKVAVWLRGIAKVAGLDLTQGVTGKKFAAPTLLLFCSLLMIGCNSGIQNNPRAQLLVAQGTFVGVVDGLITVGEADQLGDDETADISRCIDKAHLYLMFWEDALEDGQGTSGIPKAFDAIIFKLIGYKMKAEGDK